MKSLINIGGGLLLVVLLLSKKKEVKEVPYQGTGTPIIPDIPTEVPPVQNNRVEPITNASISPTLTTYEISDTDRLINALTVSVEQKKLELSQAGDMGDSKGSGSANPLDYLH